MMFKLRTHLLRTAMAGALLAGLIGAASASTVTLNPQANNGGLGVIDAAQAAFPTTNPQFVDYALLSVGASTGSTTFSESGNFAIDTFPGSSLASGIKIGNYYIYGTFSVSGTGTWNGSGTQFNTSGISSFAFNVYASPTPNATLLHSTLPTSSSATTLAQYGITQGTSDFLLATGTISGGLNFGTINQTAGCSGQGCASLSLQVNLLLNPQPGTTGATGFFQSPVPFTFILQTAAIGQSNSVFVSGLNYTLGACSTATSTDSAGVSQPAGTCNYHTDLTGSQIGTGTFTLAQVVPEPASLGLLGIGLLGLGALARRRVEGKKGERKEIKR